MGTHIHTRSLARSTVTTPRGLKFHTMLASCRRTGSRKALPFPSFCSLHCSKNLSHVKSLLMGRCVTQWAVCSVIASCYDEAGNEFQIGESHPQQCVGGALRNREAWIREGLFSQYNRGKASNVDVPLISIAWNVTKRSAAIITRTTSTETNFTDI